MPPSNSSHDYYTLYMHNCAIISDDGQWARAVSVVQLLSVADTRTGVFFFGRTFDLVSG